MCQINKIMSKAKKLLILLVILNLGTSAYSQGFLKKLGDKTMNKIQKKAEDKLVDELSEKIANQAVKPINSFMDSLFAESYEESTGEKYDPQNSEKMAEALSQFMGSANVPDSYSFNYLVEVELKDFGSKNTNTMIMLINTDKQVFGIEQEDYGKKMMMIFDNENEAVVSYNQESMEMFAFPLNGSMMTAYSNRAVQKEMDKYELNIEKTGKTRNILGYKSEEYKIWSEKNTSVTYISNKLPFSWEDSFGQMMTQFAPNFYKENEEYQMDGMLMEAKTERLSDGKKSEWKTKKIDKSDILINNSDYKRMSYGS